MSRRRLYGLLGGIAMAALSSFDACAPVLPPGDGVARLDGVDLHYVVAGSGPVLVVQPGGPGMEWKYLRMPLVEEFATVVYVDPRGSGASSRLPGLEDYRIERMAEDLEGLRLHLGLKRFALLGHSHGGIVAQVYASGHQASLTKLVLYSTVARGGAEWIETMVRNAKARSGEAWYPDAAAAFGSGGPAATEEAARERFKRIVPFYFHRWEPFRESFLKVLDGMRMTPEPARAFTTLEVPGLDTRPLLAKLRVPTLILAGRHDFACTPEAGSGMNALMPNSRLVVLEGSGHFAHLEEPEGFALALRGFLSGD